MIFLNPGIKIKIKTYHFNMSYNKNEYNKLESYLMMCKSNVNSPYNSGWDIEHYKSEIAKAEKTLKSWGKQLEFNFNER